MAAHNDLVAKHEEYKEAEVWKDNCTREYITFSMLVNDYTDKTSEHEGDEVIQDDNEAHNLDNVSHEKEEYVESAEASAKLVLLKHEKPSYLTFTAMSGNTLFLKMTSNTLSKNNETPEIPSRYYVDLQATWKYLGHNYGDPRVSSDTITADIERFKPIQPSEDHRFCDLVNLIRWSFNILKEVKCHRTSITHK